MTYAFFFTCYEPRKSNSPTFTFPKETYRSLITFCKSCRMFKGKLFFFTVLWIFFLTFHNAIVYIFYCCFPVMWLASDQDNVHFSIQFISRLHWTASHWQWLNFILMSMSVGSEPAAQPGPRPPLSNIPTDYQTTVFMANRTSACLLLSPIILTMYGTLANCTIGQPPACTINSEREWMMSH